MRGQQLIDGASFGPEAMKAIGDAFDAAWVDIAGNFGNDPSISTMRGIGSPTRSYRSPVRTAAMWRS